MDKLALTIGVFLIIVERMSLWEMPNPPVVFALGLGLIIVPVLKIGFSIIDTLGDI